MANNFSHRNLFKPTPKKLVRIGNALATLGTSVAIPTALMDHKGLAIGIFIAGAIGKLLTSFFAEDDQPTPDA